MLKKFIKKITEKQNLSFTEMKEAMEIIMSGEANDIQISAFLIALKMKGETIDEITAGVNVLKEKVETIDVNTEHLLDTCGTGGDGKNTFNISTISSIIAAAGGCYVAKHGNKALSSQSGSADVLKELGVNIDIPIEKVKESIEKIGISFLFAPKYHKAMKYVMPVRKELGVRTIFNILGPLSNPLKHTHHFMGVFAESLLEKLAGVLKNMGIIHGVVVWGEGGIDEATLSGYTKIAEFKKGEDTRTYKIYPEDFGLKRASIESIKGGSAKDNAKIFMEILEGKRKDAYYDITIYNSGLALYTADKVSSIKEGVNLAKELVDSGKSLKKLKELIEESKQ